MPNYIYFIQNKNTESKYKDAVKDKVKNIQKNAKRNKNFFNDLTFYICDSYKNLGKKSFLTKYVSEHPKEFMFTGGMTIHAIENNNKKEIIVRTSSEGIFNIERNKNVPDVTQAAIHEIGHQFDDFFGYCDSNIVEKVKKLPKDENFTQEQQSLYDKYLKNKDLSDTKIFKEAWKKDAENLGKCTLSNFMFKHGHMDYYIFDVDISDGVTAEEVENADMHRSEIFAQLFSYALGEDDGQKKDIVTKFENCYKIIKQYIKQFLGIECSN